MEDLGPLIDVALKGGGVIAATVALWAMVNRTWKQSSEIYRNAADYAKQDTAETREQMEQLERKLAAQQTMIESLLEERLKLMTQAAEEAAARVALELRVAHLEQQLAEALSRG